MVLYFVNVNNANPVSQRPSIFLIPLKFISVTKDLRFISVTKDFSSQKMSILVLLLF